ncbi:MAG TPA: DUF432 domain-containing protein [Aciduliprofundum sp.]|nr:DUF432 domain-containing protein [Aciduliprofundum sp.]
MVWKRVNVGEELELGRVRIRNEGGILRYGDGYSSGEVILEGPVDLRPARPIGVPQPVASGILIRLEKPAVLRDGEEFWVRTPYEVVLYTEDSMIARLSPFEVKFALYGNLIGGKICRLHTSPLLRGPEEGLEGLAKIEVEAQGTVFLKELVLPGDILLFYRGDQVFYEVLRLEERPRGLRVTTTGRAPIRGAIQVERRSLLKKSKDFLTEVS